MRSTTRPAHLEHLHDRAARPELDAERVAIAEARRRHLLLPIAQRLDGADGVAQVRRLLVALLVGGRAHRALEVVDQLVGASLEQQPRVAHRVRYASCVQIAATHGATQRLMSYSRQGRPRSPVITSLHDRRPNSRCVRLIVRRARRAGRNGPA